MKDIINRIWAEIKAAFWSQVPYLIWSFAWLMCTMFWMMIFIKWFMNKYY